MHIPSTPSSTTPIKLSHAGPSYRPLNSSPLACKHRAHTPSSPDASPIAARRRLQFKSRARTPLPLPPPLPSSSSSRARPRGVFSSGGSVFEDDPVPALDAQKSFLREKFKARCFERAVRARERAVRGKRYLSEPSSDFDEAMDGGGEGEEEEEDDEAIMADELFRRIVNHSNRRALHTYRRSYADEVGSSFDPDLEDPGEWENDLRGDGDDAGEGDGECEWDDDEVEAYADEHAAMADFEDLSQEQLFSLSDLEDLDADEDVDMH
ncbi:hypothetical protein C0992_009592 [Termitomyces sp. T32_za158]|nr:hypothetical protein C0992_009592 [Termitomyces sp. T32_za158]